MPDVISRKDIVKMTKGLTSFTAVAAHNIYGAQNKNAQEARSYMQMLVPADEGVTKSNTVATAYKRDSDGTIGFAMTTSRPNRPARAASKTGRKGRRTPVTPDERIKAILFANETDFFYSVWNLNKSRWRGRMRRALSKSAKDLVRRLR